MSFVLQAKNVRKSFNDPDSGSVLNSIDLEIKRGESVAIVGKSGSGKSTFLQIAGLLDDPTDGEILIEGISSKTLSDDEKTLIRRHKIGFVYQFHHLLSEFNVIENLIIPQLLVGKSGKEAESIATQYLNKFDLISKRDSLVHNLSGGERQRVAIIRSIVNNPGVIIADEPTGNLDNVNARIAFDLLKEVLQLSGAGMVIATHSLEMAGLCSRIMILENGKLIWQK